MLHKNFAPSALVCLAGDRLAANGVGRAHLLAHWRRAWRCNTARAHFVGALRLATAANIVAGELDRRLRTTNTAGCRAHRPRSSSRYWARTAGRRTTVRRLQAHLAHRLLWRAALRSVGADSRRLGTRAHAGTHGRRATHRATHSTGAHTARTTGTTGTTRTALRSHWPAARVHRRTGTAATLGRTGLHRTRRQARAGNNTLLGAVKTDAKCLYKLVNRVSTKENVL